MSLQDSTHIIHDHKWYPYFNSRDPSLHKCSLLDDYTLATLHGKLCIMFCLQTVSNKQVRLFAVFPTHYDFMKYQLKFPPERRCFFETILGHQTQKPRFDIDVDLSALTQRTDLNIAYDQIQPFVESIKDSVISGCKRVLLEKGIVLDLERHVCIFTSHGPTKRSFHIVLPKFCHTNNVEAKSFYDKVLSLIPESIRSFVDSAVYSTKQQFRCLGSQKIGSGRIKRFCETWMYVESRTVDKVTPEQTTDSEKHEEETSPTPTPTQITFIFDEDVSSSNIKDLIQLELSLISFTVNCVVLPSFLSLDDKPKLRTTFEEVEVTLEDAKSALRLYAESRKTSVSHPAFPYRLGPVQGSFVTLKRIRHSNCPICNRIHEHENPFLTVVGPDKTVSFNCRRSTKAIYVGTLVKMNDIVNDWLDAAIETAKASPRDFWKYSHHSPYQTSLSESDEMARTPMRPSSPVEDKKMRRSFLRDALKTKKHKKLLSCKDNPHPNA